MDYGNKRWKKLHAFKNCEKHYYKKDAHWKSVVIHPLFRLTGVFRQSTLPLPGGPLKFGRITWISLTQAEMSSNWSVVKSVPIWRIINLTRLFIVGRPNCHKNSSSLHPMFPFFRNPLSQPLTNSNPPEKQNWSTYELQYVYCLKNWRMPMSTRDSGARLPPTYIQKR